MGGANGGNLDHEWVPSPGADEVPGSARRTICWAPPNKGRLRAGARDTSGGPVTIGGSVALIIIGAILRFAVTWTPRYVDIQAMGVILMLGGIVGLGISLSLLFTRRRSQAGTRVTEERRY